MRWHNRDHVIDRKLRHPDNVEACNELVALYLTLLPVATMLRLPLLVMALIFIALWIQPTAHSLYC